MKCLIKIKLMIAITIICTTTCFASTNISNWIADNQGGWFYKLDNGTYKTGWQYDNENWYYLEPKMVVGWKTIGQSLYYFDSDGHMLKNEKRNIGGQVYEFGSTGALVGKKPREEKQDKDNKELMEQLLKNQQKEKKQEHNNNKFTKLSFRDGTVLQIEPSLPHDFKYRANSIRLEGFELEDCKYYTYGGFDLVFISTLTKKGNRDGFTEISFKLYDEDGFVISSGETMTSREKQDVGEKVRENLYTFINSSSNSGIKKGKTYKLVLFES